MIDDRNIVEDLVVGRSRGLVSRVTARPADRAAGLDRPWFVIQTANPETRDNGNTELSISPSSHGFCARKGSSQRRSHTLFSITEANS